MRGCKKSTPRVKWVSEGGKLVGKSKSSRSFIVRCVIEGGKSGYTVHAFSSKWVSEGRRGREGIENSNVGPT